MKPGYNETENADLSTFGFLYGTFPSANLVFILAIQYGIDVDLVSAMNDMRPRQSITDVCF